MWTLNIHDMFNNKMKVIHTQSMPIKERKEERKAYLKPGTRSLINVYIK